MWRKTGRCIRDSLQRKRDWLGGYSQACSQQEVTAITKVAFIRMEQKGLKLNFICFWSSVIFQRNVSLSRWGLYLLDKYMFKRYLDLLLFKPFFRGNVCCSVQAFVWGLHVWSAAVHLANIYSQVSLQFFMLHIINCNHVSPKFLIL